MAVEGLAHQSMGSAVIQCGNCQQQGIKQSLAKVINGTISIRRNANEYTHIVSSSITLYCGRCGEPVYKR